MDLMNLENKLLTLCNRMAGLISLCQVRTTGACHSAEEIATLGLYQPLREMLAAFRQEIADAENMLQPILPRLARPIGDRVILGREAPSYCELVIMLAKSACPDEILCQNESRRWSEVVFSAVDAENQSPIEILEWHEEPNSQFSAYWPHVCQKVSKTLSEFSSQEAYDLITAGLSKELRNATALTITPRPETPREKSAKVHVRVRELCKEQNLHGQWAKLRDIANEDPAIKSLRGDKTLTNTNVSKICQKKTQRQRTRKT